MKFLNRRPFVLRFFFVDFPSLGWENLLRKCSRKAPNVIGSTETCQRSRAAQLYFPILNFSLLHRKKKKHFFTVGHLIGYENKKNILPGFSSFFWNMLKNLNCFFTVGHSGDEQMSNPMNVEDSFPIDSFIPSVSDLKSAKSTMNFFFNPKSNLFLFFWF